MAAPARYRNCSKGTIKSNQTVLYSSIENVETLTCKENTSFEREKRYIR